MSAALPRARSGKLATLIAPLVSAWTCQPCNEEVFPINRIAALQGIGAFEAFAELSPTTVDDLRDTLRLIGGADLALGRIYEGHVNAIQLIAVYGDPSQRHALDMDRTAGHLFGVWNTEPGQAMTIVSVGNGRWRLEGKKSFATGAGQLDRVVVTARDAAGFKQMVLVDVAGLRDRADNSGWRVRGMRGTVSGLFDFTGMEVGREALLGLPGDYEREPRFSAGAWRFTAVQLGAVEALVRHLRDHLVMTGKGDDPIQRARFARCVVEARNAGAWVRHAAQSAEAQAVDAVPLVLMTRGVVEEAGLMVMEAAARAIGTASFFAGNPIDRITRDLGLYLRQPAPDQARDRAASAWLERDCWGEDPWW